MSGGARSCEEIELLVIQGVRPADDADLARHMNSCLRCFRAAADLRADLADLPRIEALLRQDAPPDPGAAFWTGFPSRVADAWERGAGVSWWARLRARRPRFVHTLASALAGAAAMGALVFVVGGRQESAPNAPVAVTPETGVDPIGAELASDVVALVEDEALWETLEVDDLANVITHMSEGFGEEAGQLAQVADGSARPVSPIEEVELLDTDDLRLVAQALGSGERI